MGDPQPAEESELESEVESGVESGPESELEEDPLVEAIRNVIYTAAGLGLLAVNRIQVARRDLAGQMPDELRDAFSEWAGQVPEDVRNAASDMARQMPDSVRKLLLDVVEQAPALADALREFVRRSDGD